MVLSTRLELRQSQTLVMTPQLQQAIKLLQLSNLELDAFVEAELERNPILERREETPEQLALGEPQIEAPLEGATAGAAPAATDEWIGSAQTVESPSDVLDTEYDNVDPDASLGEPRYDSSANWSSLASSRGQNIDANYDLEGFVSIEPSLHDHLTDQLHLALEDPLRKLIGLHLVDMVDECGYLRGDLLGLASRLGVSLDLIHEILAVLQNFEPAGVFARDLAECLTIQLKERNRFDPLIAAAIDQLDLLASHDLQALRRAIGVTAEDLYDIIAEIKSLNPKPGLKFGSVSVQPVVPDVIVRGRKDGSWLVELNSETLPKVLVNQSYYTLVAKGAKSGKDKTYLQDCLQTANWLVKSLDQRARTILKVAEEIIRQQDAFLTLGIEHLRPLNLKTVADAISMHESTVSRVTSNKYMATPRGIFELKYFFTSAISSSENGDAHSSESVRYRIKQLIDDETAEQVLSDDKIVAQLKHNGIEIARRTVAKYREAMHIPSSVQRRRAKRMAKHTQSVSA